MVVEFSAIGYVENEVDAQSDRDWGLVESRLVIDKELEEGLIGLSEFSHIIVVYHLDQAKFIKEKHLVRKPQGREDMPTVGIFSQRAKDRPNPIGITAAKLVSVENNIIRVKGLDAVNKTPILDIKPYYWQYDLKKDASAPQWIDLLMEKYF